MKVLIWILAVVSAAIVAVLGIFYIASGGPTEIINKVHINKPTQVVYDYISDMRNELKWNPDVMYMTKSTDGPVGLGTKFRAKWHLSDTLEVEITQFLPPTELTLQNGGEIEVTLSIVLRAADTGTELEAKFVATPHGFARAMFPVIKATMSKQEKENMVNLKKAIEQL